MRLLLVLSICQVLYAGSKDTIPLNKNASSQSTDQESPLMGQKRIGAKDAKPESKADSATDLKPYLASLSVYGSNRINEIVLRETLGSDLDTWIKKGLAGDDTALEMENRLADKVKKKFSLAFAEWSILQFVEEDKLAVHVTLDVVETKDAKVRMPFYENPKGELADPEGLIRAWLDYEQTALDLVETGQIEPDSEKCPAVHCPFGHKHEKLKKYEKIFSEGVKRREKELVEVLKKDSRPDFRASVAYLLPYLNDGKKVAGYLIEAIRDPDALVRNNVLRVLGDIAEKNKDVILPTKPVLEALGFPKSTDRSKAVYLVLMMSEQSNEIRQEIMASAVPNLIQMIQGRQPDQKEFAHGVLRRISGKDFGVSDYLAWNSWYQRINRERTTSSTPPSKK